MKSPNATPAAPFSLQASLSAIYQRILKDWSIVLTGMIAERGLITLALLILARRTSSLEYGQYLSSYALLSLLVVLPNFGVDTWLLAHSGQGHAHIASLWDSALRLRVRLLLGWGLVAASLLLFLDRNTFPVAVYLPTILGVTGESLVILTFYALRGARRSREAAMLQALFALFLFLGAWGLHLAPGQVARFAQLRAVLSLAAAFACAWLTRRWIPAISTPTPARQILAQARPFLWGDMATAIYLKADLTVVSFFLGPGGAGIYGPALNITNMSFLVPNALYFVIVPQLSNAFHRSRQAFARTSVIQVGLQCLVGIGMAVITFFIASPLVNLLFGPPYSDSAAVLRMLTPVLLLKPINFGLAAILVTTDNQKPRSRIQVISALFNALANLAVILPLGIPGVAAVYGISELILVVGYSLLIRKLAR